MSFPKCQSTLREREREENNDFKFNMAVEKSQKTVAAAAPPHYDDESYNALGAFPEIQRENKI